MYVRHKMLSLIDVDPAAAKKQILAAYRKAKCHTADAAKELGCNAHTFLRWVRTLGIDEELAALSRRATREGWHHGRLGGAHFHRNPEERVRKTSASRRARKERVSGDAT